MRRFVTLAVVVLALAAFSLAENSESTPKVEVFGGYSLLHTGNDTLGSGTSSNLNGWNASITGNVNRFLGLTADIGGAYNNNLSGTGTDANIYNFLFGPTVSFRSSSKLTPFAHALFGVSRLNGGIVGNTAESDFAMALGGGADVNVSRNFAIRLAQADWLRTNYFSTTQNNLRFSTGVVLRF